MASLTNLEVIEFLDRNADARGRVTQHQRLLQSRFATKSGKWDQVEMATWSLPIPVQGYAVGGDAKYGNVVIYPDASGILHFTSNVTPQTVDAVQKAPFESQGRSFEDILASLGEGAANATKTVLYLAVLVVAVWGFSIWKEAR